MSEIEPITFRPRQAGAYASGSALASHGPEAHSFTTFNRQELNEILAVYGRKVAAGEWRDYALDMGRDRATFSIFRRASEFPLYRIEKAPKLARKQGAYSVITATGLILKRGNDLRRVLAVLERSVSLVNY